MNEIKRLIEEYNIDSSGGKLYFRLGYLLGKEKARKKLPKIIYKNDYKTLDELEILMSQ